MSYTPKNYKEQGGERTVIGGSLDIVSGGDLDIESGASLKIAGVAVTASAAQINAASGSTTGTTNATFTVDSDGAAGTLVLKAGTDSGNHSTTVQPGVTAGAVVLTLPVTTGTIALTSDTQTDLDLGASGTAGSLDIFPAGAANGKLTITCTNNGGARNVNITNEAVASTRSYKIPEAGGDGHFVMTTTDYDCLIDANAGDRSVSLSGDVTLAGALTTAGAVDLGDHAVTVNTTGATEITLPTTGTLLADGGSSTLTGTTSATFAVDSDAAKPRITVSSDAAGTGDFTATLKPAATMTGNHTIRLPDADGTLALASGAETGTSSGTFTVDNDSGGGQLTIRTNAVAGTNHTVTVQAPVTTQDVALTLPDVASDTLAAIGATQTLAAKTLTAPVINGATTAAAANNFTLNTGSGAFTTPTGTFTHYGNVANNGNVTWTWSSSGAWNMVGSSGAFTTPTGENTLSGNVTISGTKTFASGTGTFTINGDATISDGKQLNIGTATGGDATPLNIFSATAANGKLVVKCQDDANDNTTTLQSGDPGAGINPIITLPIATCTLPGIGLANTFTAAQTIAIDDAVNNGVTDVAVLKHTTSGDPSAGMGTGLSVIVENDTDATTEVANLDFVMTNDGTKAALDVDVVLNTMVAGAASQVFKFDADEGDAGGAKVLQLGSDTNAVSLELHPATTASGTLRVTAADNTGDTILTVTNEAQTQATIFKIPDLNVATAQFVGVNSDHTVTIAAASDQTVTLGGDITSAGDLDLGDHDLTLNTSAATEVTLPTTGTLATLAGAEALTNKSIDGDANTVRDIAPISAKIGVVGVRGGAVPVSGITSAIVFDMDNTAGSSTWTNSTGQSFRIVSVQVVKTDGNGTAGDTVRLFNAGNAITDAKSFDGVNDGVLGTFATIDDAYVVIANGGTLVCTTADAGDHCECEVSVVGVFV